MRNTAPFCRKLIFLQSLVASAAELSVQVRFDEINMESVFLQTAALLCEDDLAHRSADAGCGPGCLHGGLALAPGGSRSAKRDLAAVDGDLDILRTHLGLPVQGRHSPGLDVIGNDCRLLSENLMQIRFFRTPESSPLPAAWYQLSIAIHAAPAFCNTGVPISPHSADIDCTMVSKAFPVASCA